MTCDTNLCVPCGLYEPRRNVYFDGKLLLARDFEDEQVYHIAKRQLLNATLHGTGTVCGLKIVEHPAEDCRAKFVVLQPGLALDCCGREIIVPAKVAVPVGDMLDKNPDLVARLDGSRDLVIALTRCDRPGELAPVILADCEGEASGGKPGRMLEGYDFQLFAPDAGTLAPATHGHEPKLDWRQTLTFAQATPGAVAIDEDTGYAYVVVVPEGEASSRIFVYERRNHDIVTALDGPPGPIDLAVSPVGDQVYLSHLTENVPTISVYRKSTIRTQAEPFAAIPLDLPDQPTGGPARLAVSPRTGALFALQLGSGKITAWSQESIAAWAAQTPPDPAGPASPIVVQLADWTARTTESCRGAIFSVSPNGAQLMVVDGGNGQAVRLIDVALLFGKEDPTKAAPLPTIADERPVAGGWSLDSSYVFVLSAAGTTKEPQAVLRRYQRLEADGSLQKRGQGVAIAMSQAFDLAVAPGERWAYALVGRGGGGEADAVEATVAVLDMEVAQLAGDTPALGPATFETPLPGIALSQRLTLSGKLLYVALADESATSQPDRGLVAVIQPDEADCGARFRDAIDGCPVCAEETHHVVLASLPRYDAAQRPRMRDRDPRSGEIAIDNVTYRALVPSAQTLREVVECILAEGVAEGPPGPRGDAGERGPGIEQVAVTTLPPNGTAAASLTPIAGDAEHDVRLTLDLPRASKIVDVAVTTLNAGQPATGAVTDSATSPGDLLLSLGIPQGPPGSNGTDGNPGPRGPGIQTVAVTTLDPGQPATASLTPVAGDPEGDQQLNLGIPRGADGSTPTPPDLARVAALSWVHNRPIKVSDLQKLLSTVGVAIGFDQKVVANTLINLIRMPGAVNLTSFVFEVLGPQGDGTCLCPLRGRIQLIKSFKATAGLITSVDPAPDDAALVTGIRMMLDPAGVQASTQLRVLLRGDFVVDAQNKRAIDGNFLRGDLPTGDGVEGGLFESWLWAEG